MKLTDVELYPEGDAAYLVFNFKDPRGKEPLTIKSILGLDADEITPQYYGSGASGASAFYNMALKSRVIVIKVGLNPDFTQGLTYSQLRDTIYRTIAASRTGGVQLMFRNNDEAVAWIRGFVQKIEAPLFEKNQEVQITINCNDPYLKAPDPVTVPLIGIDPALAVIADYKSTAPHGVTFWITVLSNVNQLKIFNPFDPDAIFSVTPNAGLQSGDVIALSSDPGNKDIWALRGENIIYLADAIDPGSVWPIMFPGENFFAIDNPTQFQWSGINYYPAYWGV